MRPDHRCRLALAMLFLLCMFLAASAAARIHSDADPPRSLRRVSVSPHGVVVERRDADSAAADTEDSRGFSVHVDEGEGLVRIFADASVPAGKEISGDVVAVFGSVDVAGKVDGDVIAVMGSVHLQKDAAVSGDAVAVGGILQQEPGASVGGESVSVGFLPISWGLPALPAMLGAIFGGWLAAMFFGWVFALVFPTRLVRVAATASRRSAASFFLGLLSLPGSFVLFILLCVTVVGVPIALLEIVAYPLLVYAGQIAATYVLGCKLTRRGLGGGTSLITPLVAGTLFVAALFILGAVLWTVPGMARPAALFFMLIAALLVVGLSSIGTGAFLLSRFGSEPRDVDWHKASAIPAPPEPFPGPSPASPPAP